MTALLAGAVWACLIGWLLLRLFGQFAAHRESSLGRLAQHAVPRPLHGIAIIVPARNEAGNIRDCLAALSAQQGLGPDCSITVIDDGSSDGTAAEVIEAVRADPRIALVSAGRLPPGWFGKPYACWQGALRARGKGEWLCFIDADVRAAPELLQTAVAAAERHRIDMLSLNPFQELGSFWERLIIPPALILVGCAKDLRLFADPGSAEVSANGQFLLVRRGVYFDIGGHAAVHGEVCEDKALAARIKRAGRRFRLAGADEFARTRMYTGLASLWEGLSKNATEIMGDGATTVAVTTAALAVAWSALLLPLLSGIAVVREPSAAAWSGFGLALAGSIAVLGVQLGTVRHFRIPAVYGLFFPLAYGAVAALAWHGAALRRAGRVSWKGRTYQLDRKA